MKMCRSISRALAAASAQPPQSFPRSLLAQGGRPEAFIWASRSCPTLGPFGTCGWFQSRAGAQHVWVFFFQPSSLSSDPSPLLSDHLLWDKGASFQRLTPAVSQRKPFSSRDLRWIFLFSISPHDFFLTPFILFWHLEEGKWRTEPTLFVSLFLPNPPLL